MQRFVTRCGAVLAAAAIVAGACLGTASPASAATPAGTLDQSSTWTGTFAVREASDISYQVFTAGLTGVFTGAEIDRETRGGSRFEGGAISVSVVTMADGWPTTTVLGSGEFPEATTAGWQSASFDTPFTVTAGQQYALQLTPKSTATIGTARAESYTRGYSISKGIKREYSYTFRTYVDTTRVSPAFTAANPLLTWTVNTPYPTYTFAASGTPAPTFALASGSLPAGLTLSTTGRLSGTPTHAGKTTFTVQASNGIDPRATSTQTITIGRAAQTVTIISTPPLPAAAGSTYELTATGGASGNPVTFSTTTPDTCSVTAATVTLAHIGLCVIFADQAGNADYLPGTATQEIGIGMADQAVTITSSPPTDSVAGSTYEVTAAGGGSGNPITFSTNTPDVCSVTEATVALDHAGSCVIFADQAGNADYLPGYGSQTITIGQAAQTVTITSAPPTDPVAAGSTYEVTATGGGSGNPVTFSTSTPEVCSITAATVTVAHPGSCVITAEQAGNNDYLPGTATQTIAVVAGPVASLSISPQNLTVTQGDAIVFTITGTDAGGNPVDTTGAILTSGGPDLVGGHTVLFSGAGDHVVTAILDGVRTSTTIRVVAGPLAALSISPASATVVEGGTTVFTLTGTDAAGNPVSVDDAILTAAPTDTVDGRSVRLSGAGTRTITATLNGVSTTAEITVTPGPLSALTLTPASTTATQGDTIGFTVTGTDAAGNRIDTTGAVLSSNTRADTITGTSVTFSGAGTHIITATLDGVSTSAQVEVVAGPLAALTVTPATATVAQGDTTVFTITGADAAGNPVNVDAATLTSTAEKDVVDGRAVTFSGAGTRTIIATLDDVTATASIDVVAGPVATLTLTPSTTTVTQGDTIGFTVTGADAAGNPIETSAVVLTSSIGADTITGTSVTFSGAGTHMITATLDGVSTSAPVEVVAGPAATLTITPSATTVDQGGTLTFTVTGADAGGNPVDTSTAVLTSSVDTDVISGTTVAFPHASPHTITATLGTLTATVTIQVTPATVPSPTAAPAASAAGLANTGLDGGTIVATGTGAVVLLLAGAALLSRRRNSPRATAQKSRP